MLSFRVLYIFFLTLILSTGSNLYSQVGINTSTPNSSSLLEVSSSSKGLLIPRMTTTQRNSISSPSEGLQVYDTDTKTVWVYNGSIWISKENRISAFVDAGTSIQLDNLKFQVSTSGARSLQLATSSGTNVVSGMSRGVWVGTSMSSGGNTANVSTYITLSVSHTTSFKNWDSHNFGNHGSTQVIDFYNETTGYSYKVMMIIGDSYNDNFISVIRQ